MDDLIAFVTARLDEDEAAARAASGTEWIQVLTMAVSDGTHVAEADAVRTAIHIARHDPARVLREVEAGRRILERHAECATRGTGPCWEFPVGEGLMCRELADLLYRWADHPDYQAEWKP